MEFILTRNIKNLLNAFNDNYISEAPTSVSNLPTANHGHNLITMGPVSKDSTYPHIFTSDATKEGVIAFNSTGTRITDRYCYYVYDGNFVQKYTTASTSNGGINEYFPIYNLMDAGSLLNLDFGTGFTTWVSDTVPPFFQYELINTTGSSYAATDKCTIFFCEDLNFDEDTNTPTGKFKSVELQSSSVNKSTKTYTVIDPYDGEITAKTVMIGVNLRAYGSGVRGDYTLNFDPVIIGGAVLDNAITLDRGTSVTFQIDWGIHNLT